MIELVVTRRAAVALQSATIISLMLQFGNLNLLFPKDSDFFNAVVKSQEISKEKRLLSELPSPKNKTKHQIYWNASCPFEESVFTLRSLNNGWVDDPEYHKIEWSDTRETYTHRAELSRQLSIDSDAVEVVRDAILNARVFENRKVVIVGDSIQRQLFTSLSCLAQDQIKSYAVKWIENKTNSRIDKNEARVRFKNNGGELFYAPRAGRVLNYTNWVKGTSQPWEQPKTMFWIKSCRNREPFRFMTYKLPEDAPDGRYIPPDDHNRSVYERVILTKNDVVILNGSLHRSRTKNLFQIKKLLKCMENARRNGEAVEDWPTILYIKTTYKPKARTYGPQCGINLDHTLQNQESKYLGEEFGSDFVGSSVNYHKLSGGHVWGGKRDCIHYMMPGVPDLVAADLSKKMMSRYSSRQDLIDKAEGIVANFDNLSLEPTFREEESKRVTQAS